MPSRSSYRLDLTILSDAEPPTNAATFSSLKQDMGQVTPETNHQGIPSGEREQADRAARGRTIDRKPCAAQQEPSPHTRPSIVQQRLTVGVYGYAMPPAPRLRGGAGVLGSAPE